MIEIIFEASAKSDDVDLVIAFLNKKGFHVGKRLFKENEPDADPNPTVHLYVPAYEQDNHKFARELTDFCRKFNPSPLICIEVQ